MQVSMRTGGAGGSRVTEGNATGLELGLVLGRELVVGRLLAMGT